MASGPLLFDRRLLRARRLRAQALGPSTFLIDRVADELGDRLAAVLRQLRARGRSRHADRCGAPRAGGERQGRHHHRGRCACRAGSVLARCRASPVAADEEALPFRDGSLDLVVSALALQFVNDLPGTLIQIRRALKPDGLLLAALAGGDTLTELRQAFAAAEAEIEDGISPRVAPFADVRELGALLQRAGFALPVTDVDRLTVRYASPVALMHDLRRMGATNALGRAPPPPAQARDARADGGDLWRAVLRSGRPHPGDLRDRLALGLGAACEPAEAAAPGSARQRLADALGVKEMPAGEKAGR